VNEEASKGVENIYLGLTRTGKEKRLPAIAEEIGNGKKNITGSFSMRLRRKGCWTP